MKWAKFQYPESRISSGIIFLVKKVPGGWRPYYYFDRQVKKWMPLSLPIKIREEEGTFEPLSADDTFLELL